MAAASIRSIDLGSVNRIHSGQVVLDLQSCLKELVENSLDADATSIEVRIRDHGLSSIEILDNGSGISPADWPSIGLKHHTSKLPDLALLHTVDTFGFRGEALAALCALCESVSVTTSTREMEPLGAVIKLGRDGKVLDDTGRVARQRGTTIALNNLFAPLPVRRKEFERNAKRELGKALTLLTAYALIPCSAMSAKSGIGRGYDVDADADAESGGAVGGVRLRVDTFTAGAGGKGVKRSTVLANDGRGDLRASCMAIWGSKALEGVQEVDMEIKVKVDYRSGKRSAAAGGSGGGVIGSAGGGGDSDAGGLNGEDEDQQIVKIKGLISSAAWGQGRSSSDRQYLYVNGRPVDLRPVQKTINEVYKSFNTHQMPLAILDFKIPRESVDINVSPDKRTIFIHSESNFLAALRTGLEAFWAPSRSTFALEGATQTVRSLKSTQARLDGMMVIASQTLDGLVGTRTQSAEAGGTGSTLPSATAAGEPDNDNPEAESRESEEGDGDGAATADETAGPGELKIGETAENGSTPSAMLRAERIPSLGSTASLPRLTQRSTRGPRSGIAGPLHHVGATQARLAPVIILDEEDEEVGDGDEVEEVDAIDHRAAMNTRRQIRAVPVNPPAGSSSRTARPATATQTGHTARRSLKERLAMYSQNAVSPDDESSGADEGDEIVDEAANQQVETVGSQEVEDAMVEGSSPISTRPTRTGDRSIPMEESNVDEQDAPVVVDMAVELATADGEAKDEVDIYELDGYALATTLKRTRGNKAEGASSSSADEIDVDPSDVHPPALLGPAQFRSEITSTTINGELTLSFSMPRLRARYAKKRRIASSRDTDHPGSLAIGGGSGTRPNGSGSGVGAFSQLDRGAVTSDAGIGNKDSHTAEAALSRVIHKRDFERMEVVGQFNKGFIIARLRSAGRENYGAGRDQGKGKERARHPGLNAENGVDEGGAGMDGQPGGGTAETDDLFIIDQHACDEKYNFETLQRTTVIKAQALIRPRPLQLTAGDELTAIENLDTLKANGFEVVVDEDAAPGRAERVKLVAMPVSKETVFDFRDLEQLLHLLSDSSHSAGQMVRCSKARSMFAMRACRKSVMIGKSLTRGQMTQLLRNMGTIDQPWNCPHGRPTMRHLIKIDTRKSMTGAGRIDWKSWAAESAS